MALIKFTRNYRDDSTDRGFQTDAAVQQARQVAQEATYVTKDKFEKTVVGACPNCGASITPGAKFCASAASRSSARSSARSVAPRLKAAPKFCPECGAKM